ncbi:MAG TPA: hypothetical protein PK467_14430, partial [Candidatus Wallbacteria bacterium]|nr:hypothetical protein [Candidatus Wallbacteria bacterium]
MQSGVLKRVKCPARTSTGITFKPAAAVIAAVFFLLALLSPAFPPPVAAAGSVMLPEKHSLRPISKFKVVLPYADASRIFQNNKMVMVDYEELDALVEKNNKMISERYSSPSKKEKTPPADYIINSASYKFIKDHDNILCGLDIDFSVLARGRHILIPLIGGSLALSDAVIDDTVPVIISEPLHSKAEEGFNYEQQVQQAITYQQNNINVQPVLQTNDPDYSAPAALNNSVRASRVRSASRAAAASRYSLLVGVSGRHTLSLRFILT